MTTTLPAIVTERKSKSEIITDLWKKICNKLYVPVHSMNEVTSKLFAETKEFPDGDSHFVITRLIEKCKSNGKLLDAIMQEQKSYAKAFDYFYSKAGTYGFKMKHGCYLDNKKALKFNHKMAPHFLIREPDKYTCTCCGKETEIPKKVKPFRHLAQTTCPKCGAPVTVQLRTIMKQFLDTISWTTVLQKTTDGGYVMRYLLFDRTYSKERGMVDYEYILANADRFLYNPESSLPQLACSI